TMYKKLSTYHLAIFSIFCSLFIFSVNIAQAEAEATQTGAYTINNIEIDLQNKALLMVLEGDSAPAYTMYELFNPSRLVLDIAETKLAENITTTNLFPENDFASLKVSTLKDQGPEITRFEITLAPSHTYKVDRIENNLSVQLFPKTAADKAESKVALATAEETVPSLHDIVVRQKDAQTEVLLLADSPIKNYRHDTLIDRNGLPDAMYIDINNIDASELVREKNVGTNLDKIRVATRGSGVRIVFDSGQEGLFTYNVETAPQGLLVTINESTAKKKKAAPSVGDATPSAMAVDPTLEALIGSSEAALITGPQAASTDTTATEAMQDSFEFSGYKSKRISVDFYKIDLHNVFRLFRQISDVNLIVDEAVSGSLTLALNDVPWDFALDIILNLKNLKKEERHNTIVIYPAKNSFIWPDRATDNLSFEADIEVVEQEALIIQQSTNQPVEIMHAKELLRKAKIEEKNDDLDDAVSLYEQAFKLWPTNAHISNRLAVLCLANLGMNAKAVHYAKESLKIDPKNYQAALYAAIGSANMEQIPEAIEFFSQSISGEPPMKEALVSYAAFSEEKGQPEAALKLLSRYGNVYGDSVDTMISKARIYDNMGQTQKAKEQYKTLLYSGYQLVPGLKKYIQGRLAMKDGSLVQ
ncbi:MAG: AMIN domain-containing protein, partial [Proteobacteria bacterium]|nr:AMIN domain-containing protein [Pseudomonadota bacterium]MBU1454010.1 AMIN domain-containing protein [Pseudomonadota bacterium]